MLTSFYGVIEIKHSIKDRMRVIVNKLKNSDSFNYNLFEQRILSLNGINSIQINKINGSLLIYYDQNIISEELLFGILLNLLELEDEVFQNKDGTLKTHIQEILSSVDIAFYNKTKGLLDLKTAFALMFLLFGLNKLRTLPKLPIGSTLIWWAFNLIRND